MNQHYFVGIPVPKQQAISLIKTTHEMELKKTHKIVVASEDMHITLMYLGAFNPNQMHELIKYMESASKCHNPFEIHSTSVRVFGNEEMPRVVYANIVEKQELHSLQSDLSIGATKTGLMLDKKPFVPHITLSKKWSGLGQMQSIISFNNPISFNVEKFSLFEIRPNQSPKYKPIATFQLGDR